MPTDFSDVASFAIDHATEIAKLFNHKICLLHIVQKHNPASVEGKNLINTLEDITSSLMAKTGLEVSYMIEEGTIFKEISKVADRILAEFIVMGIHGKKGLQHIMGSFAYKVVISANVPVLIVKHLHHHVGYDNIVVPIDFSRESTQKIQQAVRFAKYFDATVRVFGFLSTKSPARIIKKEALLKKVKDIFDVHNVKVTTSLLVEPGTDWPNALIKYSEELDADLVMIVAEKDGGLTDVFSQNSSELIIDKIDVPVLTVCRECDPDYDEKDQESFFKTFLDPMDVIKKKQ